ncbi:MAG: SpoIIE family protein phosphatase, partial [Acidobacteriota bacterium]
TDGVVEVTDPRGTEFDTARLEKVLRANAHLPASQIIDAVVRSTQAYGRAEGYADDFTLMVVKRSGGPV